MSHPVDGKLVDFQAYHFENAEKAQKVKKDGEVRSKGNKKSRLHLLSYNGIKGKDLFAVAAEKMDFKAGDEKLGWWDRKFNVLVQLPSEDGTTKTWYKINKNSLKKRLDISSKDLDIDEKTGRVRADLAKIVEVKQKNLDELNKQTKTTNVFEKQFLHRLAEADISSKFYDEISFLNTDTFEYEKVDYSEKDRNEIKDYPPHAILLISYRAGSEKEIGPHMTELANMEFPPLVHLRIDSSAYEKILSGKSIPKNVLDQLNPPLNLPSGTLKIMTSHPVNPVKEFKFNAETTAMDIDKWWNANYIHNDKPSIGIYFGDDPEKIFKLKNPDQFSIPLLLTAVERSLENAKKDGEG